MNKYRTFEPTEIIFAATDSCNLHCGHCFVHRKNSSLNAEKAIEFLNTVENSENNTIEKIGFSGGEPFLALDFITEVSKACVEKGFMFDQIITNGDWWKTKEELISSLNYLADSGYDGKFSLSFDSFHGQDIKRAAEFIKAVHKIFKDTYCLSIQSVINTSIEKDTDILQSLAQELGCTIEGKIKPHKKGLFTIENKTEGIFIPVFREEQSFLSNKKFEDKKWFKDDYCAGPGNVLYVHANGNIAPCCGFANENPELIIGNLEQPFDKIMENAHKNKMVCICYETGLLKQKKIFKKNGINIEGKTQDMCRFCDFVCKNLNSL